MAEIIYDKNGITLYHGDCKDVLPILDMVDHVISDPPYEAEAHTLGRRTLGSGGVVEAPLDFAPISNELRAICGRQFARLAKRWVIVFCQVEAVHKWIASLSVEHHARLLTYRRTCVWVKPDAMPQLTGDRPGAGFESIVMFHADERSRWNGGGKSGVFRHNKAEEETAIHKTQKPQKLMRELIHLFTDQGEMVLDPFCGSGSTAVACRVLGRRCITIERDPEFAERAMKRFERMDQQGDMFETVPPREGEILIEDEGMLAAEASAAKAKAKSPPEPGQKAKTLDLFK